jgi:ubiquitin-conjugating enzyme E2 J2
MATPAAYQRLRKEYKRLQLEPIPQIHCAPNDNNILEWHYVIVGPSDSLYSGGYYHGKLLFPKQYPYKPPSIIMLTPSGRFKVNTRLCLSMSDYRKY